MVVRAKMWTKIDLYESGTKRQLKDVKLDVYDVNMLIIPIYGGKLVL